MAEPKQVKVIKGGLNIAKRLLADGEKEAEAVAGLTAAQRAEAGRKAAELIKSQPQVKASEALGQLMEKGFKKTTTTQADRTRVGGGNIGGAPFPAISEADPAYKGKVWGVMDEGTAARLKNLTDDETAWTTMLGSASQLKTNPIVFDKLKRGFIDSMKRGNLSPELAGKINHNLALTFGEGADIRDPKIWRQADTFEKRAALADVMMGQGTAPSKGGIAIGGEKSGKGVIFKPTDILKRETEPSLLHTEHGGDVPTFAAGPRLFRLNKESVYDPTLHPGFPTLLTGEDLKINMKPTPTEVYLRDWHQKFKKDNPERKGPGYYDLALGVKGEGLPSQELNDEYIRHLLREGFKKGGAVNIEEADQRLKEAIQKRMAKGGRVNIEEADAKLRASIQARMGMAQGGEVGFKKIQFMDKGGKVGKLASGVAAVGKRLLADEAPKPTAPPAPRNVSAGDVVNGMLVRKDIPNTSSIGASLSDYSTHGLQEVPMSVFETVGKPRYRSVQEEKRTKELARQIQENKELNPLIVVKDAEGHYILEGGHRFDALRELGIDSFPALMVHDLESLADVVAPAVKKAEGGGAFKKLEFMDKGGKVGKLAQGVASVGKRLLADNSLPALEREANLQKFLAESKTPMRLYHGTTATEGGKGTEAIRRIKPSKEGALGSGVYTTPNTAHASSYTGIPNDDAIEAMRGSEYYSKMADQFMADRAAGRLREGQAGGNMLPVHVQMRNPLIIGKSGRNIDPAADALMSLGMDEASAIKLVEKAFEEKGNIGKQIQSRAQAQGYDGIMQYRGDDLSEVVSYNPNAVKSAIGNRGTYDINEPDLSKARGGLAYMDKGGKVGKVVSGLASVSKRLLADAPSESKIIQPPSIIIPSKIGNVKEAARKSGGEYGARRVERAADEVPNLEKLYKEQALKEAFTGDNAKALMTMNPKDFEKFAMPLDPRFMDAHSTRYTTSGERLPYPEYMSEYLPNVGAFDEMPFLVINKQEQGLPLVPFITGHEGRHRNRVMADKGEKAGLVQLLPRSELREPLPRRSQQEYIEALKEELAMTGNKVKPEDYVYGIDEDIIRRSPIILPDIYAKGGLTMADGGSAFKKIQFMDKGGITTSAGSFSPEELGVSADDLRVMDEKTWNNIKRNAPATYEWAKQNIKDEASQLKTAKGAKDFALRVGASYAGALPDFANLLLMAPDAVFGTELASEKPWFGSAQYLDAMNKAGMLGENEFPIAETVAGILTPAGLIKKGVKKVGNMRTSKETPKKRQGGLTAMAR